MHFNSVEVWVLQIFLHQNFPDLRYTSVSIWRYWYLKPLVIPTGWGTPSQTYYQFLPVSVHKQVWESHDAIAILIKSYRLFGKPLLKCEGSSQAVEGKNVYACHLVATDLVFQTVYWKIQGILLHYHISLYKIQILLFSVSSLG